MLHPSPQSTASLPGGPDQADAVLVAAARGGDEGACHRIWSRYAPMVHRLIRTQAAARADGDDLVQEVFLRVFSRLDEVRDPNALRGFIAGICLGVVRNASRRSRVRAILRFVSNDDLPEVTAPSVQDEPRQVLRHLFRLLAAVSAEDRSLFVCRYVEGMEMKDIAIAHGLGFGTAKRRVARMTRRISLAMRRDAVLVKYAGLLAQGRA